ncbi:MAG: hypothetical protein VYC34_11240, partial [Planctomycetota bacterium]|nr:hypothetical protein [Planctomycetota bacterium]
MVARIAAVVCALVVGGGGLFAQTLTLGGDHRVEIGGRSYVNARAEALEGAATGMVLTEDGRAVGTVVAARADVRRLAAALLREAGRNDGRDASALCALAGMGLDDAMGAIDAAIVEGMGDAAGRLALRRLGREVDAVVEAGGDSARVLSAARVAGR